MIQPMFRTACVVVLSIALVACANAPQSPETRPAPAPAESAGSQMGPKVMLWVGNSFFYYNNSMHSHLGLLVRGDKSISHRGVSMTISGSGIDWHDMAAYLAPQRLGAYTFVGDNEIRFNPPGRQFDAVMMMDCSQCPIHPQLKDTFYRHMKENAEKIRAYGARPILFMSWAYKDKPEMTPQLANAYVEAGRASGAQVVPAGLAFASAVARRPDLELYAPDKRHPSLAGTYLGVCTVYASLFGKSPVGNEYTAGLPKEVAGFLQQVAWETVQAFKSQ